LLVSAYDDQQLACADQMPMIENQFNDNNNSNSANSSGNHTALKAVLLNFYDNERPIHKG
jgi:hypothetical protein